MSGLGGGTSSSKVLQSNGKFNVMAHVKYEHLVAGISGGITSTLILHPLDLIKIRFAGKNAYHLASFNRCIYSKLDGICNAD